MAGTLEVQTIQGPSSGANANKVIIPSGQTLDVSGGTFTPSAGQIIQTVTNTATANVNIATTSETATGLEVTITPTSSSSDILVFVYLGEFRVRGTTGSRFQLYRDSTKIADLVNEGGYSPNLNTGTIGLTLSANYVDSPSTTSAITYKLYGRELLGLTGSLEIMPNGSSVSRAIAMEIAQ
jgi:hypothetical protein